MRGGLGLETLESRYGTPFGLSLPHTRPDAGRLWYGADERGSGCVAAQRTLEEVRGADGHWRRSWLGVRSPMTGSLCGGLQRIG